MNPRYPAVAASAACRCEYCRAPEQIFNFAFEVEHIQPRSLGGQENLENLALSCASCNLFKSNHMIAFDEIEGCNTPLFNPRRDIWDEHFVFDKNTLQIIARSVTGRVTIRVLHMNADFQIRARRYWISLDLFP